MLPSPRLCRFGRRTSRDSQMWPNVSDPASPQSGASGIAPMPAPSRTIRIIRSKGEPCAIFKISRQENAFEILSLSYLISPMESNGAYVYTPYSTVQRQAQACAYRFPIAYESEKRSTKCHEDLLVSCALAGSHHAKRGRD